MNPFASINSGIELRDYPSPEPVDIANNSWLVWVFLFGTVIFLTFWLMYRRRLQSAALMDPLLQALQHATDNSLSTRERFQTLYSALRSHLAKKHDASWKYLAAEELKSLNLPAVEGFKGVDSLREQWLQLESLAYSNEEISDSQLNAAVALANNLALIKKMKN